MADKHIANREAQWCVLNIEPDVCIVDGEPVLFDICRTLDHELMLYAKTVFARGEPVVLVDSVVQGVVGNAGKGIQSQVSLGNGHVWVREGSPTVYAEGRQVARHLDRVYMNCSR